jgi:SecD/SecF fusion protein
MLKNTFGGFVFVALLIAGSLFSLRDYSDPELGLQLGIDLQGGTELVYRIDRNKVAPSKRGTVLEDVKSVIASRFDAFGLKEISIATAGSDQIVLQLPGFDDASLQRLKQQIERSGELSFHLESSDQSAPTLDAIEAEWRKYEADLAAFYNGTGTTAPTEPSRRVVRSSVPRYPERMAVEWGPGGSVRAANLVRDGETEGSVEVLTDARSIIDSDTGAPAIAFDLSRRAAPEFGELTGNNVNQQLCVVLDGALIQYANINSRITDSGRITGDFSSEEVNDTVTLLRAGSLAAKPELENEQTVGALLGKESVTRGTTAMVVGFTIVVIFMLVYYMAAGVVANIALFLNMLFLLAAMQIFRNTLTFPGMAGLILTVGMAVDANILIFARIREEKARGRGLAQAVQAGYQRAFWTIFDANVTTLITAYILFKFGSGSVKGFAVVLAIGIIASFFTAVYVSRLVMTALIRKGIVKELRMMALFTDLKIDFMAKKRQFATLSVICLVVGTGALMFRGKDSLGLDFTGGGRLVANLQQAVSEDRVRDLVRGIQDESGALIFDDVQVQSIGAVEGEGGKLASRFSIRTRHVDEEESGSAGTDRFRSTVAAALEGEGLLAPDGIVDIEVQDAPPTFSATLNVVNGTGNNAGLTPSSLEQSLRDAGFPVAPQGVTALSNAQGSSFEQFRVTATPTEEITLNELEGALSAAVQGGLGGNSLSTPFDQVDSIGGRVAQDMQGKVFISLMVSFFVIVFYISLRFRFQFGLAAIVALVHDLLFVLGAMAVGDLLFGSFLNLKINLPVIAALLTTIGYSLNDTIVIFDRIRENLQGKKRDVDYSELVNQSINQTLSRTILTSMTTFVVVSVLLIFGGEGLQAFSVALVVGVLVGTYSSMFVASPALIYFHKKSLERREAMLAEAAAAR